MKDLRLKLAICLTLVYLIMTSHSAFAVELFLLTGRGDSVRLTSSKITSKYPKISWDIVAVVNELARKSGYSNLSYDPAILNAKMPSQRSVADNLLKQAEVVTVGIIQDIFSCAETGKLIKVPDFAPKGTTSTVYCEKATDNDFHGPIGPLMGHMLGVYDQSLKSQEGELPGLNSTKIFGAVTQNAIEPNFFMHNDLGINRIECNRTFRSPYGAVNAMTGKKDFLASIQHFGMKFRWIHYCYLYLGQSNDDSNLFGSKIRATLLNER